MRDFTIRIAEPSDIGSVHSIMTTARSSMKEPELYVPDTPEFISRHIQDCGFTLLALYGTLPAGFLIVRIPGEERDNLGYDLGFSKQELSLAAHMESAAVLPEYQGNRLQRRLISSAEAILSSRGYQYALATVSPKNFYSLRNMLACGYRIAKTTTKYGGLERHILLKSLGKTA